MTSNNRLPFATPLLTTLIIPLCTAALLTLSQPASAETTAKPPSPERSIPKLSALKQASAAGDIKATRQLGDAYLTGTGVPKNTTTAFQLYVEAARAGDAQAQFHVGEAYHRGEGTDSNQIAAWIWLTLAGNRDSSIKEQALALRTNVEKSLSESQRDRAQVLADNLDRMLSS